MNPSAGRPRVVDFSTHLSGPMASYLLRDLGADVIKIENPWTGDGLRSLRPPIGSLGKFHAGLNPGARSLAVSVHSPAWSSIVEACARWADAVIVGSRPTAARARGLDFATLRAHAPDLVYCAISGYGLRGPWSSFAAHGQNTDAMAGLLPVEWGADGMPATPEGWRSAGSTLAGVFAALGIMSALYARTSTGRGAFVAVSMWQCGMWWNWRDLNFIANEGHRSTEYQSFGSRYAMYPTRDGRAILVCPIEQHFWHRFCDAVGLPEQLRDRGQWSINHVDHGYDDERGLIVEVMRKKTLADWSDRLAAADVPFAPVLSPEEALASEHSKANRVMRSYIAYGQPIEVVASPVRLAEAPEENPEPRQMAAPPELGQDSREILVELGLADLELDLVP